MNLYGFVGNDGVNKGDFLGWQIAKPGIPIAFTLRTIAVATVTLSCDHECCAKKLKLDWGEMLDFCDKWDGKQQSVEYEVKRTYGLNGFVEIGLIDLNGPLGFQRVKDEALAKAGALQKMKDALSGKIDIFGFPLLPCVNASAAKVDIIFPTTGEFVYPPLDPNDFV